MRVAQHLRAFHRNFGRANCDFWIVCGSTHTVTFVLYAFHYLSYNGAIAISVIRLKLYVMSQITIYSTKTSQLLWLRQSRWSLWFTSHLKFSATSSNSWVTGPREWWWIELHPAGGCLQVGFPTCTFNKFSENTKLGGSVRWEYRKALNRLDQ